MNKMEYLIVLHSAFFYTSIAFYKIFGFYRIKYVYFGHLESYLRIYQWNLIAVLLFYIHCYTIFYFSIYHSIITKLCMLYNVNFDGVVEGCYRVIYFIDAIYVILTDSW